MYNTASPFSSSRGGARVDLADAYHQVGVHTGVTTASPHRLVSMLFEGLLTSLAQAQGAIAQRDVQAKGRALGRAAAIVEEGLKSALNLQQGGQIAADLNDLYAYVSLRLTQANRHNDASAVEECKRLIEPLREAWETIGPQVNGVR